jgi:hypothetical protein
MFKQSKNAITVLVIMHQVNLFKLMETITQVIKY